MIHKEKPVTRREAERAAEVLGLSLEGLKLSDPSTAYREFVKRTHPDTGFLSETSAFLLDRAKEARATLIRWVESLPDPDCPLCKGIGVYNTRRVIDTRPCPRCS